MSFYPLRMSEEQLKIGDNAADGEEAYALAGQEQQEKTIHNGSTTLFRWPNSLNFEFRMLRAIHCMKMRKEPS